ncbi:MAG: SDR family oxidoreductase [Planctomycetes bacterium]|nr:SDR family oxidoreductase [Planctomycetota bacterium]
MGLLTGKNVIITGAGKGIGRETAKLFAQEGANLIICARTEKDINETAEICRNAGAEVVTVIADVRKYEDMAKFVEAGIEKFGQIHIAVSNAGFSRDGLFLRMKPEDFEDIIDTNLKGAFYFSQVIARHFRKFKEGRLIFVSSIVGLHGNPGQANYAASKGGVIALGKTLAKELMQYNVLVNMVAPAVIDTPLTRAYPEQLWEAGLKQIPMKRYGKPEEVSGAILFFAGPHSTYVTGQVLKINGGLDI